jgi:hypothetical protein
MDTQIRRKYRERIAAQDYAKSNTEFSQQVALFMWASENMQTYPMLRWLFAIPNGGKRNLATASLMKASGVKRGVADVFLPYPCGQWHGLFIEMKRPQSETKPKGKSTSEQIEFSKDMIARNYGVATCFTFQEARDVLIAYINHDAKRST